MSADPRDEFSHIIQSITCTVYCVKTWVILVDRWVSAAVVDWYVLIYTHYIPDACRYMTALELH